MDPSTVVWIRPSREVRKRWSALVAWALGPGQDIQGVGKAQPGSDRSGGVFLGQDALIVSFPELIRASFGSPSL